MVLAYLPPKTLHRAGLTLAIPKRTKPPKYTQYIQHSQHSHPPIAFYQKLVYTGNMIQKMRYITISGHASHIDRAIEHYLGRYDIHLEYALHELRGTPGLRAFSENESENKNPYREAAAQAEFFLGLLGDTPAVYFPMTGKQATETITSATAQYNKRDAYFRGLEEERAAAAAYLEMLRPFCGLDADLLQLDKLRHVPCVFGRMPLGNYLQFEAFVYADAPVIFVEAMRDGEFVWGCYFGFDDILAASYNFERIPLSAKGLPGTPSDLTDYWERRLAQLDTEIRERAAEGIPQKNSLLAACHTVLNLQRVFSIKQYAARTADYYIFTGWMPHRAAKKLEREAKDDDEMIVVHYEAESSKVPPTKLANPPGLRWFEFFVRLYGLPKYDEIDPTPILGVLYVLLFGMMFGDVGHGFGLALLGWFLLARSEIGGIMISAGVSAMFFGLLYGSVFGIEDMLPALWRHPIQDITGTLMFAVILGAVVILLTMGLNMLNALRRRDFDRLFFSPNGAAGLLLYLCVIAAAAGFLHWAFALVPLAAVVWRGGVGNTAFERAFGVFEIMLAYLTNTLSFVRVGAFALSHAGMMHVVMMLSDGVSAAGGVVVFILGNFIVMSIEGLLIGIQSLRLGFYEIFSRFYEGGGRNFESSAQKG